jgi:hypothetical protein
VPAKTTILDNGQEGYFSLQTENTTDVNSISTDDMNCQYVNNEKNPANSFKKHPN